MINITNPLFAKANTLSASKLNRYFSCGHRFLLECIYEMRPPGGINAIRGSAVHKAIEIDNRDYIENRTRLNFNELKKIAEEKFDSDLVEKGVFIPKSKEKKTKEIVQKAWDEIIMSIQLYANMKKEWEPVSVEENYTIDIGYPLPVVCYMDMVDEDNCIWDWKTTAKRGTIYEGIQNWFYSKVYEEKWGIKPTFKYCCFILTKDPDVDIQTIEPIQDYSLLDKYVEVYLTGIEKNIFFPASAYDFLCAEAGCPFYLVCDYKHREEKTNE